MLHDDEGKKLKFNKYFLFVFGRHNTKVAKLDFQFNFKVCMDDCTCKLIQ